jgi:hypothetical protein
VHNNNFLARYDIILDLKIVLRSAALETWPIAWRWLNLIFGYDSDVRVRVTGDPLEKRRQDSEARAMNGWLGWI